MTSERPKLRCLPDGVAPDSLGDDLSRLLDLPDRAREGFWKVLAVYLEPELDEAGKQTIVGYCERFDLTTEQLAPAIRAARFLFDAAATAGTDGEALARDIATLLPEEQAREAAALLVPWFDDLVPRLRRERIERSIGDHGKLVVDTHWRVDRITSSDRAGAVNTSVAVITLSYREGSRTERITLHMLPDQLDALRRAANQMLT